jgi:hypothetical protein
MGRSVCFKYETLGSKSLSCAGSDRTRVSGDECRATCSQISVHGNALVKANRFNFGQQRQTCELPLPGTKGWIPSSTLTHSSRCIRCSSPTGKKSLTWEQSWRFSSLRLSSGGHKAKHVMLPNLRLHGLHEVRDTLFRIEPHTMLAKVTIGEAPCFLAD